MTSVASRPIDLVAGLVLEDDGVGAIVDGESYVRTFETGDEHECGCIPHEAAGTTGTAIVE